MNLIETLAQCEPAREIIVYYLGGSWGAKDLHATCRAMRAMIPARERISERAMISRAVRECNIPLINYMRYWGGSDCFSIMLIAIEECATKTLKIIADCVFDYMHVDMEDFEVSVDMSSNNIVKAMLKANNVDVCRVMLRAMRENHQFGFLSLCSGWLLSRSASLGLIELVRCILEESDPPIGTLNGARLCAIGSMHWDADICICEYIAKHPEK